jgi:hypothetical protein
MKGRLNWSQIEKDIYTREIEMKENIRLGDE